MHVGWLEVDPGLLLRLLLTVLVTVVGLLQVVKNTASKYFEVDANFDSTPRSKYRTMSGPANTDPVCANCFKPGMKQCSGCKSVRYCSLKCQETHWKLEHKVNCRKAVKGFASPRGDIKNNRSLNGVALVPATGSSNSIKKISDVLFPYEEFVELYNWDKTAFPPCGLINCNNSCFANVVLQCLTFTKPLVAYLLGKGHRRDCKRTEWCFFCVFEQHVERASQSTQAFSPLNILSRLHTLGGNIGYGKQEDAHEFMRIVIQTMQSICLDEFGGEKYVSTSAQETTLVQHIFGGLFQSQVVCTKCDKKSIQLENMMDLTVEIHGEAGSLEGCLDQFTSEEWLHGDNMYKCDGCDEYVKALKRLSINRAPNVLTIVLKRFQNGRFGKLNKRVTFPEVLDLTPYMSHCEDPSNVYKLYAVVVHIDMLNASFFGHYICYTLDFHGNWYRVDDCKVDQVDLDDVLSQGAYMLLYSRISVRKPNQEASKDGRRNSHGNSTTCLNSFGDFSHLGSGILAPLDADDAQPSSAAAPVEVSDCCGDMVPGIVS